MQPARVVDPYRLFDGLSRLLLRLEVRVEEILVLEDPVRFYGSRLRLTGKGGSGLRGGENGDLYVQIAVRESDIFEREGQNLFVEVPVSPITAALGGTVEVPAPGGAAQLKIPAGTPNGKMFRMRGQGVPSLRGGSAGDLSVRIVIETPVNLDRKQKAALEEFQKLVSGGTFPEAQAFAQKTKVFFSHKEKLQK